ncbi:adenylosuccinate synthetase [Gelidibacter salicanalis]|uniref:Adenylosuccinate synthetase n=1 Tax=Gelidibacter salicanalis TaxID=291193 RepID=A0A934KVL1_9FLAO|nr:adenylosuccinate synthetase [Gelidibacter salicanalis]MBJ7882815.1 adenylosuccinate synthetase [Gelidibacter salicanalis]
MLYSISSLIIQLPPGTRNPDDNSPLDFTNAFDVIVYIILPILLIIFYVLWRRSKKRHKD